MYRFATAVFETPAQLIDELRPPNRPTQIPVPSYSKHEYFAWLRTR